MAKNPELTGYYFVPPNAESLIKLTFHERCTLLMKQGNYTVNPNAKLSNPEKIDMECALDNSRIPTHRRMGARLPDDFAYGAVPIFTLSL